jgi:hypothetical protein
VTFNYLRVQAKVDRMIRKFGRTGVLRRDSGDRTIQLVLVNYTASERANSLIQYNDQKAIVSAKDLVVPPDNELDKLVVGAARTFAAPFTTYDIIAPPGKLDPAGVVVYYELQVRK